MATRRRIGVSAASTEAARRQLMQPVPCWEQTWAVPENIPNVSFKVRKWVRTDKPQVLYIRVVLLHVYIYMILAI